MLSRKRGGSVLVEQDAHAFQDTTSSSRDQAVAHGGKRCCGAGPHAAVGALSQAELAAFISSLLGGAQVQLPSGLASDPEQLQAVTGLSVSGWQAFAELSACLSSNFHLLTGSQLRSYHSFTTQDRAALWQHYAAAHGLSSTAAALVGSQSALPCHLRLVKFLLEVVLTAWPAASITKFSMSIPNFAVGWASRWHWSSAEMSLLILQVYAPTDPSSSRGSRQQMRRLFVPMLM